MAAATALAGVTVYKNTFARKGDAKELRHAEGKHCKRSFRKKAENLQIDVTKSPEACGYRPPVEGDTDGPDHSFQAKVEVPARHAEGASRKTPTWRWRSARASRRAMSFACFPVKHRFRLSARPRAAGSDFPADGKSSAIKGFNKANVLGLKARGSKLTAPGSTGPRSPRLTDSNPAQVGGRKLEVAIGERQALRQDRLRRRSTT